MCVFHICEFNKLFYRKIRHSINPSIRSEWILFLMRFLMKHPNQCNHFHEIMANTKDDYWIANKTRTINFTWKISNFLYSVVHFTIATIPNNITMNNQVFQEIKSLTCILSNRNLAISMNQTYNTSKSNIVIVKSIRLHCIVSEKWLYHH